ncbi:acetylornithine transaminase [Corynebacterium sanguinis]|uniref:Acetylornithine aminotransferase n=1 Tax=Corynebacterium sanguinis TaxID=2594913 RepID=A0A6C1TWB6_9CORY|nr:MULTISPECIES: acetylornithine transaminase [Corynebacterium]MBA4505754.1 acetylornithine transaminase [Corynebacterium sanguinis]MCT1415156.1 acetylornithine transaminase [Corynebacterium sanguinis]MCT1556039.1 acetylornithine transaminase [Corynebacterium sanguinis]MCT1585621.1 acetylornithine transaminase [Corynebacterium sanguinis]MCT1598382.1 acetylornithine transaminase [Corynebacterium sanguinis]
MSALDNWGDALMNNYGTPPIELASGRGAVVTDAAGRSHIDMLAGIAVNALGHAHPAVIDAVTRQISSLGHVSNLFASQPVVELGQRLKAKLDDDSARVFFCNSGGEANEAAFKLARLTGRRRVLAAHNGFHGRTMGSLALTGQPAKRAPFEPLPAGVEFYPYGDIDYLRTLVEMDPANTAAIFLEPVQGETGVIPAPEGFLEGVRELCDDHGILMVTDEVQTGVGRTGTFFAFEHACVVPDVITMAKGLGGGLPIGATIARGRAAALFQPGSHGTTFGGNPVACAAALAVLDVVDDAFIADVARKGALLRELVSDVDGVESVRGRGLMLGVVLEREIAKETVAAGFEHGVILNAPSSSVLRLTPPLVITDDEIREATSRIAASIAAATEGDTH